MFDAANLRAYYQLAKPGIIYGNLLTCAAGFFVAAQGQPAWWLLVAVLAGTGLVIASACVFNNYFDRELDRAMGRTKKRALVTGSIPEKHALIYAAVLGVVGFVVLSIYTNLVVVLVGAIGFVDYLVAYGFAKRRSPWGTLVGSVAGATPPVAGYCAVTGRFDLAALILFLMLVCWQMPHFYAIAMRRADEYAAASVPVLPLKKGNAVTKVRILLYIIAFIVAAALLAVVGYAGLIYNIMLTVVSAAWLILAVKGFHATNDQAWARRVFLCSLAVLTLLSVAIIVDAVV